MTGSRREDLDQELVGGYGYGYQEPDYSSPLYTLSLLKKEIEHINNLIIALEKQLTKS